MIAIMSPWTAPFTQAPRRSLSPGETLFLREEEVRFAHLVVVGSIALERPLRDGRLLFLHNAVEGALVAEASLFSDAYHCNGIAGPDTIVATLPRHRLLDALRYDPDALMSLLAASSREVQQQRTRVEILRLKRLTDRLDAWLDLNGSPQPGGWIQVAERIGVTPPALYRELARRRGATAR